MYERMFVVKRPRFQNVSELCRAVTSESRRVLV